jgi:hypothetical protein
MEAEHPSSGRTVNPKLPVYYRTRQNSFITNNTCFVISRSSPVPPIVIFTVDGPKAISHVNFFVIVTRERFSYFRFLSML